MYDDWVISRWETPVVDATHLGLVSLVDANRELAMVFEVTGSPERLRWCVRFRRYPGYRNIDEAYRTALWQRLDESGQRCGATFTVQESTRLASWDTGYLQGMYPHARHFVIATDDDVIEVISDEEPVWDSVEPGGLNDPPPGKSKHLYIGKDDAEIARMVAAIKGKQPPQ